MDGTVTRYRLPILRMRMPACSHSPVFAISRDLQVLSPKISPRVGRSVVAPRARIASGVHWIVIVKAVSLLASGWFRRWSSGAPAGAVARRGRRRAAAGGIGGFRRAAGGWPARGWSRAAMRAGEPAGGGRRAAASRYAPAYSVTSSARYWRLASVIGSVSPSAPISAAASPSVLMSQYGGVPERPCSRPSSAAFPGPSVELHDPGGDAGGNIGEDLVGVLPAGVGERPVQCPLVIDIARVRRKAANSLA